MKLSGLGLPKSVVINLAEEFVWDARNKEMLLLKIDGYTYEEIAEKYNLSVQRTKQIVCKSQNLIIEHL